MLVEPIEVMIPDMLKKAIRLIKSWFLSNTIDSGLYVIFEVGYESQAIV